LCEKSEDTTGVEEPDKDCDLLLILHYIPANGKNAGRKEGKRVNENKD